MAGSAWPEAGRDDVDGDAGEQQGRGVQMCRRSCSRAWELVLLVGADELGHQRRDGIGVDRLAPSGREHVAILDPRQESPALSCSAAWSALRWRRTATVSSSMETTRVRPLLVVPLTRSPPITAVEPVMVIFLPSRSTSCPPEVEQLAATCSGVGGDVEEREQPVLLRGGQERPELGDGPDRARLVGLRSWPLGPLHRIAADQLVHDDRITERLPEHRVQMGHGGDGERLPVAASAGQQVPVQLGDGGRPDGLDRQVTDARRRRRAGCRPGSRPGSAA